MSTHEPKTQHTPVEPGSDRSFGLVVGGVLLFISGYLFFTNHAGYPWTLAPGLILILAAGAAPRRLHGLNVLWTRFGLLLGRVVAPVMLFLVWILTVVPTGVLMRLAGKDLLRLKRRDDLPSYWIERSPPGPAPESLKDQF